MRQLNLTLQETNCAMWSQAVDSIGISVQPGMVIDGDQIRAARAGLGWLAQDLATRAGLSVATIRRAEAGKPPGVSQGNLFLIQRALEAAGITFLDESQASPGGGRGLRLPRQQQ
jgi:transcriptional regulator with XRE-family HTH domain